MDGSDSDYTEESGIQNNSLDIDLVLRGKEDEGFT